jgi:hypothetical protein
MHKPAWILYHAWFISYDRRIQLLKPYSYTSCRTPVGAKRAILNTWANPVLWLEPRLDCCNNYPSVPIKQQISVSRRFVVNIYDLGCALSGVCISVDLHGCKRRLICYVPDNEDRLIILSLFLSIVCISPIYPSALHGYVFLSLKIPVWIMWSCTAYIYIYIYIYYHLPTKMSPQNSHLLKAGWSTRTMKTDIVVWYTTVSLYMLLLRKAIRSV